MGFSADKAVEKLKYEFKPYVDDGGDIPEPDIETISEFWTATGQRIRENQNRISAFQKRIEEIEKAAGENGEPDIDAINAIRNEFEQSNREYAIATRGKRGEILSAVCGGKPTPETLAALPGRIFDAFENYILESLSPKA